MKIKESKGSIAIYVIVSFIFLTIILISMLAASKNSQIVGLKAQGVIKNVYENDIDNTDEIYSQMKDNDTVAPTVTISTIANSTDYLFAIKAVVTITDNDSGVDFNKCKYVFTTSNEPIGTNIANYTDGSISAESTTIEKAKGAGTYYLHVLATDNEENSKETVSSNSITIGNIANYSSSGTTNIKLLPGSYEFECWGAQGSSYNNTYIGGKGGYTKGEIRIYNNTDMSINVGEAPNTQTFVGGFNGGGNGSYYDYGGDELGTNIQYGYAGGGATDIRLDSSLNSRIMVAAGGGGAGYITSNVQDDYKYAYGGAAGGLNGSSGYCNYNHLNNWSGTGATQTEGGYCIDGGAVENQRGTFGAGGYTTTTVGYIGPGGGGGYYRRRSRR